MLPKLSGMSNICEIKSIERKRNRVAKQKVRERERKLKNSYKRCSSKSVFAKRKGKTRQKQGCKQRSEGPTKEMKTRFQQE